jgi:hypothetical protein
VDKNVIFIYPLNTVLNELKKELEKDESFSVLEVDMLEEYAPLVESIDHSITLSADLKKTAMFLEACRKYTKEKNHLNILISKQVPSGLALSRMEKDGLNEFLGDFTKLKTLMVKINHFYKDFVVNTGRDFSAHGGHPNKIDTTPIQRLELTTEFAQVDSKESMHTVKDEPSNVTSVDESRPEASIDSLNEQTNGPTVDRSTIAYSIKNKNHSGAVSSWTGLAAETVDRSTIAYSIKKKNHSGAVSSWTGLAAETFTVNVEAASILSKTDSTIAEIQSLPEITFFPALRIFDPIAFFMEILLDKSDSEFKKKYLKMCLLKVYQAEFYSANSEGEWEESTPASLQLFNSANYTVPSWIDEGRNEHENLFIMPIVFDDTFLGGIGLLIHGQITHEKMLEMEFWCYLGRCTCT